MTIEKLKQQYESVCNEYLEKFCRKQEMTNEGWVGDEVGGVAECSDFYFDLRDIAYDINSKQPAGRIINWYYESVENYPKSINYFSYCSGLRFEDI